jgi:tetratricopeptide (TPR) repeat protein
VADDLTQIVSNSAIKKLSNVPLCFTSSVWSFATNDTVITVDAYYRPLFMTLFTVNYAIAGLTVWGWHLINLLIHATVTLLVFVAVKEVSKRPNVALLTSALFAVHPAHAESVAWVSGITDPFTTLFLLPAFLFYLRFRDTGGRRYAGLMIGCYLLALFAKETSVALLLITAYCDIFHFRNGAALKARVVRALLIPALLTPPTVFYLVMRFVALKGLLLGTGPRYPLDWTLMTIPLATVKYLKLMILPWGHSYQHYTQLLTSLGSAEFLLPLALLVALIAGIILTRSRLLLFAAVWFISFLAPALVGMRQFDPEYLLQDRYLYIPSIGFCLALALGIDWLARRAGLRVAAAAAAILIIAFGIANVRQNSMWKNGLTIFQNCVDTDPESAEAHVSFGRLLFEHGKVREGEEHLQRALELAPATPHPYLILSYFERATGKTDGAIGYLEQGIASVPETPITRFRLATIYLNLALLKSQAKNPVVAEQLLLKSAEVWPRSTGWLYLGQFYLDQGRAEEALEMFKRTQQLVPDRFAIIHLRLGQAYDKLGQIPAARAAYERYLALAPEGPDSAAITRRLSRLEK